MQNTTDVYSDIQNHSDTWPLSVVSVTLILSRRCFAESDHLATPSPTWLYSVTSSHKLFDCKNFFHIDSLCRYL